MEKSKELCKDCREDYYNHNRPEGCWMYKNATVVKRQRVGTWQPPPYSWHPETVLSCYRAEGFSMLPKDDCRIQPAAKV